MFSVYFFFAACICLCSFQIGLSNKFNPNSNIFVIFGRPGSGKSTITNELVKEMGDACISIDLDVCIPQQLKDDLAKGIYPKSDERIKFMNMACDYVDDYLNGKINCNEINYKVISFSFVNNDMRNVFRHRYPDATWILIDTPSNIAEIRIEERKGHFYKGPPKEIVNLYKEKSNDWEFDDVEFTHIKIDGAMDLPYNTNKIKSILLSRSQKNN